MADVFEKDPDSVEPFFIIWCDEDSTNDGLADDGGELQGATIDSVTWTIPSGITKDSDNENSVTIAGITYDINTVATAWLSGGTAGLNYDLVCEIDTSDNRTLNKTITIKVREL